MKKRREMMVLAFCLAMASLPSLAHSASEEKKISLVYLTTPPGTAIYSIAVAQSQVLSRHANLEVVPQPATGVVAMPGLLTAGQAQLASAAGATVWEFFAGVGSVDKPFPKVRVLQAGHDLLFGFVTRENTGIRSIPEMKGHKVTTNYPTQRVVSQVGILQMKAYGLDPDKDVKVLKSENSTRGISDLADSRTDVTMSSVEGPMMKELAAKTKFRVLPFDPEKLTLVTEKMPGTYLTRTRPGLTGVEPGTPIIATASIVFATTDLPDDTAYLIVKTLLEKYDELVPASPDYLSQYSAERAVIRFPVPYHTGAIRYYKEKGLWSSDMDKLQKTLLEQAGK
jgi:TRAP transporter TAXI family solute receptor